MDKYEYSLKTEQLKKYALEGLFDEDALEICESINWKKEKDVEILSIIAKVYEKYRKYENVLFVLERMYKLSNKKRKNASRIINVALEYGDYDTASSYLEEYKKIAPKDTKNILWEYRIAKGRLYSQLQKEKSHSSKAEVEGMKKIIPLLEKYVNTVDSESGMYELAEAYHRVGDKEACVAMCDKIAIWFSVGPYVEKALRLKTVYVPLSDEQREMIQNRSKYEEKLKEFVNDLGTSENIPSFMTKEEAKERAKERAKKKQIVNLEKTENPIFVKTDLDTLGQERKTEGKQAVKTENLAEQAKTIHHKAKKVSIDSLEKVHKLNEDYKKKVHQSQVVEEQNKEEKKQSEVEESIQNVFYVDVSEEMDITKLGNLTAVTHFVIESDMEKQGVLLASALIKEMKEQGQEISNEIVYTSGEKLRQVGIEDALSGMSDVILLVKRAGSLADINVWELQDFMESSKQNIRIILLDTKDGIDGIWKKNISLQSKFPFTFVIQTMTVDELADYAVDYAESKNCILHDMAYIPLYDIIEMIVADKKGNEKKRVENFMDYVIENASGRKLKQMLRNIFFVRQDEQGKTILYEKDFE